MKSIGADEILCRVGKLQSGASDREGARCVVRSAWCVGWVEEPQRRGPINGEPQAPWRNGESVSLMLRDPPYIDLRRLTDDVTVGGRFVGCHLRFALDSRSKQNPLPGEMVGLCR